MAKQLLEEQAKRVKLTNDFHAAFKSKQVYESSEDFSSISHEQIDATKDKIVDLVCGRVSKVEADLKTKQGELDAAQKTIDDLKKQLDDFMKENKDLGANVATITQERSDFKQKWDETKNELQ